MTFPFPDDSPVILVLSCFFPTIILNGTSCFFQSFSQSLCDSERTLNELRGARTHARTQKGYCVALNGA